MTDTYDSVAYQTTLVQTYANVKSVLERRLLDPLRYIVEIDAQLGLTVQLSIAAKRCFTAERYRAAVDYCRRRSIPVRDRRCGR